MTNDETQNDEQRGKADYCVIFSGCFKKMREEAELTQGELAEALEISRQSVNAIEKGKSLPSIELAASIAQYFETTIDAFLSLAQHEIKKSIDEIEESDILIEKNNNINIKKDSKMNLIPWGPSNLLDDVFREDLFMPVRMSKTAMKNPQVDVYEKGGNVMVEAQLPGIKAEEVNIEVGDNFVTLSGEMNKEKEEKDKNYYRREISYDSFFRTVPLPSKVVSDKAEASCEDGVLIVTIPKKEVPRKKVVIVKVKSKK